MLKITDYKFYHNLKNLAYIDEIWLFGSRARKDNQERADIDLAISCKNATPQDWSEILDVIEKADTLLKIDCIRLDQLKDSSPIAQSIKKEGIKLYDKSKN